MIAAIMDDMTQYVMVFIIVNHANGYNRNDTWEYFIMRMDGMGMLQNGNGWNRNIS
jgi:hypothetical protein